MDAAPEPKPQFAYRRFLVPTLLMILGGWGGLAFITNYTLPSLWPRWGFFALIVIALTGTAMPIVYFINNTFSTNLRPATVLRESIWVGVYGAGMSWLQLGRILNFSLGLWLAVGIIIIEYIIRWSDTAAQPAQPAAPETSDHDDAP
ncbi:MAG: hypothetical protein RBS68_15225 [Anaerolineales bacterium]|jgi:hypothetical protein|nr:hypothetical protein [Anaerolineales bacterium]